MKNNLPVKLANKFFSDLAIREAELAGVPGAVPPTKIHPSGLRSSKKKSNLVMIQNSLR